MVGEAIQLEYEQQENILYIATVAPVELMTREEIAGHFDRVLRFWRARAGGKKCYVVVDITNFTINMAELEFYSEQARRAHDECAITSVRCGGDPLQRTLVRLGGMKIHRPSNLYRTREEALVVVRALQRGELQVDRMATEPRK